MPTEAQAQGTAAGTLFVTLSGLPLFVDLKWPFHRATSGADFYVLHADLRLADGSGLHAPISLNLAVTVKEVLPSMEPKDVEAPVVNALRKEVDRKQLEFLKSGKMVPVHFSSRHYDFKRNRWSFGQASDEDITQLLLRKVYWSAKAGKQAWIADPVEALYVDATVEKLRETANKLAGQGLITLNGEQASATEALMQHASTFESDMRQVLEELEKKHEFERG